MNQDDQIKYWANMLNEAMEDKALIERSGQDGYTPISHPRTRNRSDIPVQYMIMVDAESPNINDWHTKFAMQNLQLTNSIRDEDEAKAFKTTMPGKAMEFANRIISKYPSSYVILCKNEHSWAPMRRQHCKRFGVCDIYEPGFGWRNGGRTLEECDFDTEQIDEVDLGNFSGTMTDIIKNQIMEPLNGCRTPQDVFNLVKSTFEKNNLDTPASRRLLLNIQRSRDLLGAMKVVTDSYLYGSDLGVNGKRRRFNGAYESEEQLDERRMSGPAAAARGGVDEIAEFRGQLAAGVVEFEFTKADGTRRHAVGTTNEQVVPTPERRRLDPNYDENLASYERRQAYIIWFWDLEKNECRCFNTNRFEGIVHFEPTNRHVDMNVDRVGNIFIHRDVDAEQGGAAAMDDEQVKQINDQIENAIAADEMDDFADGLVDANDGLNVAIQRGQAGEPVLRIEIRRHGNENDQPYQLRINELRRVIRERWNVDVKKVVVDGEFQF